ncbi:MAG: SdiA-regulated domain-containing protein [Candidatus Marinimicrobia bacterium]|nr:SdiA-regulated domain-containing protein [Candidatus Neomarinimicrobiota bacterium]
MKYRIIYTLVLITIVTVLFSCNKTDSSIEKPILELINKYVIDVGEPSGLVLALDNKSLWTVSDNQNKIYQLDLTGQILKEISIPGIGFEGIALDLNGQSFWIVQESRGELLQIDTLGNEIQTLAITNVRSASGGLEGITINSTNNHLFLLKEKDPSVLIELNVDFETMMFKRIYFAQDYSGMDYTELEDELWIVSDQEKKVYRCDLNGNVLISFPINVDKAEGIAIDSENNLIYIVSDSDDILYIYRLN